MRTPLWFLATMAVLGTAGAPAPASAQSLPNQFVCPRDLGESNADWKYRCEQEETAAAQRQGEILARQSQDVAKLRATLQQQPALPATRNRILGRWTMPATARGSKDDPLAILSNILTNGTCAVLFGNGTVEFRADRWVLHDADGATDLGPASYREGTGGIIYILPQKSLVQLLGLKLETPDSLSVIGGSAPCSLLRANGTATPAPPPAGDNTNRRAPASGAVGQAMPQTGPPRLMMVADRLGYVCPNGDQVAILSCSDTSDNAACAFIYLGEPLRGGRQYSTNNARSQLVSKMRVCRTQRITVDNSGNVFAAK